jgi:hypothetical protein
MSRLRSIVLAAGCALLVAGPAGPAEAATPIRQSGHVGRYAIQDTAAHPGAACEYAADGSRALRSVRIDGVALYGLRNELQKAGYRLILQRRTAAGWRTVASGRVRTTLVEKGVGNGAPASRVALDPADARRGRYRVVVRLLWFSNADLSVEGRLLLRLDHLQRPPYGPTAAWCPGMAG